MAKKFLSNVTVLGDKVGPIKSKGISIIDPGESINVTLFFTDKAITIKKMVSVLRGASTPVQGWTVRHNSDRSSIGSAVVSSGSTTNSTSTGNTLTTFDDATIPANSFVWLRESAGSSGTVSEFHLTIYYTEDI